MRALGIDHGKKRVGVAVSEGDTGLARPLEVVSAKDRHKLLTRLGELVKTYQAEVVVVGHPLSLSGESGHQARQAEQFAQRLESRLDGVPVQLWDERLSSAQVDRVRQGRQSPADGTRDMLAAVVILQSFLDRNRMDRDEPHAP